MRQPGMWMVLVLASGCSGSATGDALAALAEGRRVQAAHELVWEPLELASDLTAGDPPVDLAADLEMLFSSILLCATVVRDGNTLSVDYGQVDDGCALNGLVYGGVHGIDVLRSSDVDGVDVRHTFTGFTDGTASVDGTAVVALGTTGWGRTLSGDWDFTDGDGVETDVAVSSSYTLEDPVLGLRGPVQLAGGWDWNSDARGSWAVGFDGVRFRLNDPVPEAGTWNMIDPADASLALTFSRLDASNIEAVVTGLDRTIVLNITQGGLVTAQ